MNYYYQWWEKARNQGTILTKKKKHEQELAQKEAEKARLKADIFELETSTDYQSWLELTEENQELKTELNNLKDFSQEQHTLIQNQESTIEELEENIKELSQDLSKQKDLAEKKNTLLRQLLSQKQEQLNNYD